MPTPVSGNELKGERQSAGPSQEDIARIMGVSVKTVQRLEQAQSVKPRDAAAFRGAIDRALEMVAQGQRPDKVVPRGTTGDLMERVNRMFDSARSATELELPRQLQLMALDFEREAVEAGADRNFMRWVRTALRDPELVAMFEGGYDERPMSADEQKLEMEAYIDGIRAIMKRRIKQQKAAARK